MRKKWAVIAVVAVLSAGVAAALLVGGWKLLMQLVTSMTLLPAA